MENQIKITISGPKGRTDSVAEIISTAVKKMMSQSSAVIVFNYADKKPHPATENADIVIEAV